MYKLRTLSKLLRRALQRRVQRSTLLMRHLSVIDASAVEEEEDDDGEIWDVEKAIGELVCLALLRRRCAHD